MSKVWYGSINNRLEENKMFCDEIKVGTGMTEYDYSDRHAYEVVEVVDQKHVYVRQYDRKHIGENYYDNNWELISNENNPIKYITRRGNGWYWTSIITKNAVMKGINSDDANKRLETMLFLAHNNLTPAYFDSHDEAKRYYKANVSFGVADEYYDYEF